MARQTHDGAKPVKPREIVTCDFTELTEIRDTVRKLTKKYRKKLIGTHRGNYDYSGFYVGRGVTRISFFNLYVSMMQMKKLAAELVTDFDYRVLVFGNDLHVYLRGTRK